MEKFKAVEKEMKTKAYSKEGLQAAAKMDPKDREKADMADFLARMVEDLERQIEQCEAETDSLTATTKRGKKDHTKIERISELEGKQERHKWHISKLELILRALENGGIEVEQVKELEEEIKYYVENNTEVDFMEDEEMYDVLDLQDEEDLYGMTNEVEHVSSHDAESQTAEPEPEPRQPPTVTNKAKAAVIAESTASARRPSTQMKSPLPALATLNTPLAAPAPAPVPATAKPAPLPTRTTGEPLKYASAAAAAAASDKNGLGLPSLPPPIREAAAPAPSGLSPALSHAQTKPLVSPSPSTSNVQPVEPPSSRASAAQPAPIEPPAPEKLEPKTAAAPAEEDAKKAPEPEKTPEETIPPSTPSLTNGDTHSDAEEEESIFHLPSSLSDLLESFEATKAAAFQPLTNPATQRQFIASGKLYPDGIDSERPQHYRPQNPYPYAPPHYPQEPLSIFDDSRLYGKCDTDTLFYSFYYKQGTYQQFAAAKALKAQSWRFHKQYQTWFQRHEEPKDITEDYEQGTYRFFDYESTW